MKRSGHFSVAVKQESLFSIKWDLTTFNLLMNQFHSQNVIFFLIILTRPQSSLGLSRERESTGGD